jgi:DNA-binding MarR family transcriptional regulator
MHISESEVVTTKGLCKAFGLAQENLSTVLRALERRGFIRDAGKVDAEGRGRKPKLYMLTGYGRTLAKRLAKVQGLGNNYAMMRGHR